jgi:hypothetical protein
VRRTMPNESQAPCPVKRPWRDVLDILCKCGSAHKVAALSSMGCRLVALGVLAEARSRSACQFVAFPVVSISHSQPMSGWWLPPQGRSDRRAGQV